MNRSRNPVGQVRVQQQRDVKPNYRSHEVQRAVHADTHRFKVLCCGRRWGKSLFGVYELYKNLVFSSDKNPRGWIVAPTYPMVREDWRICWEMLAPLIVDQNVNDMRLTVIANVDPAVPRYADIELKSAERSDEGLRGAGLTALLVDEASRVGKDAWEFGLRPSLADKRGKATFISTPKGMNNFYDLWKVGMDGIDEEWASWQFPSVSNPFFPKDEWEKLEKVTPKDLWRQEYLAEFLEDGASIFHGLSDCEGGQLTNQGSDRWVCVGVDLARKLDFTVLVHMDDTGQVISVIRSREMDWSVQRALIKSAKDRHPTARVVIDSSGVGDVIEEDLRKAGVAPQGVKTNSPVVKTELIENLLIAIESGHIRIPSEKNFPEIGWLWDELRSYTREETGFGHFRYQAPAGKHDDGVIALALAAWGQKGRLGRHNIIKEPESEYTTYDQWKKLTDPHGARLRSRFGRSLGPYIKVRMR